MYEEILEGIFKTNSVETDQGKADYLRSLQPYSRALWEIYQKPSNKGRVTINYSDPKVQEAYLLRYVPSYSYMLLDILDIVRDSGHILPESHRMRAAFFGCGPLTELCGITGHLDAHYGQVKALSIAAVDSASHSWSHTRSIIENYLERPFWSPRSLDIEEVVADIQATDDIGGIDMRDVALGVAQNCFNEVPPAYRQDAVKNVIDAFSRMKPGAIGLIIDRSGYPATEQMFLKAKELAAESLNLTRLPLLGDGFSFELKTRPILSNLPEVIRHNFMHVYGDRSPEDWDTHGLIFANKIRYHAMAFEVLEK